MENKLIEVLESLGAQDIKSYSLISNWGFTYMLDGKKCDSRFWANCYGVYVGAFSTTGTERAKEIDNALNAIYNA